MNIPNIKIYKLSLNDAHARTNSIRDSVDHLQKWLPWATNDYSQSDSHTFITYAISAWETDKDYVFSIKECDTNKYLGEVKLLDIKRNYYQKSAALAYWVSKSMIRKGIASEAAQQALRFAFNELDLIRVEIMTEIENIPSQKVAENINAQYEGIQRNKWFYDGAAKNIKIYSIIPEDLSIMRPSL